MYILLDHLDKLIAIASMLGISIIFRIVLVFLGQVWVSTISHTATIVILPIITYVITNVITDNIALSLGMVGALSIVRFRNPVRSPLELSVYFGAITMGIAASVNLKWLFFFVISILFAIFILVIINILNNHLLKKPFFTTSFTEGNSLNTLEIIVTEPKDQLDNSVFLKIKRMNQENVSYNFASTNINDLKHIISVVEKDNEIISYQLKI